MATLADVARVAGVATSTVSHVLNGTRFVSAETTLAVQNAMREVNYTPNTLARALARSTTNTIGLAISSTKNCYFADAINAIEEECERAGMMVLLANTRDDPEYELKMVAELHKRRVDGLIIAPACGPGNASLTYLRERHIPTVMVDRLPDVALDGVAVEGRRSLAAIVSHIVGHGHKRIGFIGGPASFTTAQERVEGFRDGLRMHGLTIDEACISIGHNELTTATEAAVRMITAAKPVTAMIGGNDLTTVGIMLAVREIGLRVPADLAVAGFDDFAWADAFEPRLTAMAQPYHAIGRTAAELLKSRIESAHGEPRIVRLDPHFVIRNSCGCP
ncbi:LacI family DNA-binding transcriptional regulator [Paraburkholderia phosphatilytica]|uniref:LacI family DNA-binding transcriptional regulator n=1 Tax=Paraburkholderia phosphatilytica TaxID=2282883 RepID=UPI000E4F0205|nr:LacI family DNA-binding transcriptional regulator [Paraburkholderia phosphatilytica]